MSLDHGVRRFSRLLTDHVQPPPVSVIRKPKSTLLPMTLDHGAGVHWSAPRTVTYSRPPWWNPPSPLKNDRSGCGTVGSGYVCEGTRGTSAGGRGSSTRGRSI